MDKLTDRVSHEGSVPPLGLHAGLLRTATFPPFSLYVRDDATDGFSVVHAAGDPVYANTLDRLERLGVDTLYVDGEERDSCYDYVEDHLPDLMDEGAVPDGPLAAWIYRLTCRAMESLMGSPDSLAAHKRVAGLIRALVDIVQHNPRAEWDMTDCRPINYSTPAHCVNVCALLVGFAFRALGVKDETMLTQIAMGGVLHDLGKAGIDSTILNKPSSLTHDEFALVKQHPSHGLTMARPFLGQAAVAQSIIVQHHENAHGDGYPEGRSGDAINVFARAARLVDVYDALTSNRPYGKAVEDLDATRTMIQDMGDKFDMTLLRKFVKHLETSARIDTPIAFRVMDADAPATVAVAGPVQAKPPAPVRAVPVQAPAPQAAADGSTVMDLPVEPEQAALQPAAATQQVAPIQQMGEESAGQAALLTGLMDALTHTLGGPLGQFRREQETALSPPMAALATAAGAPEGAGFVGSLFPVVWQLDEWEAKLATMSRRPGQIQRVRAEAEMCLRVLRSRVVDVLAEHCIEVIDACRRLVPAMHETWGEWPMPEGPCGEGRVTRVGFLHRDGDDVRVIVPARVALYTDRREAG